MGDEEEERYSRRVLMSGAVAAAAATIASAVGWPFEARADDGEAVRLGRTSVAAAETRVRRSSSGPALSGEASGPGVGVVGMTRTGIGTYGIADSGHGVVGESVDGIGIEARSSNGVALRIRRGRLKADGISGVAFIAAGDERAIVRPGVHIAVGSFVLLSPMVDLAGRDLWYTIEPGNRTITVRLSRAADTSVRVGWLLVG